jgi:ATP-binding cassette subfamily B (MDR/TAP) protein 1
MHWSDSLFVCRDSTLRDYLVATRRYNSLQQMNVYTIAFWVGGKLISDNNLNFQSFQVALMALAMGASGMGTAAGWVGDAAKAKAATSRIFELFDRIPLIDVRPWLPSTDPGNPAAVGPRPPATTRPHAIPAAELRGSVTLQDVHFAYPTRPTARVFTGLNLSIPAGQTAALVGSSGCGKSTIIQLLQRFYDPAFAVVDTGGGAGAGAGSETETDVANAAGTGGAGSRSSGTILLDGIDIKTLDLKWLRDNVGCVGQEPVLFDASVATNIAFGKPDATRDEVIAAAKAANAHGFIEKLPHGYDTNVGQRGGKVSGGQKQRIAIARAIIKQPRILLLDEATSALDTESEQIVQASLDALIADKDATRTTIVIAHRLSTIRQADCIYVLENSGDGAVVVESGKHEELLAKGGKYAKLQLAYTDHSPELQQTHSPAEANTKQ